MGQYEEPRLHRYKPGKLHWSKNIRESINCRQLSRQKGVRVEVSEKYLHLYLLFFILSLECMITERACPLFMLAGRPPLRSHWPPLSFIKAFLSITGIAMDQKETMRWTAVSEAGSSFPPGRGRCLRFHQDILLLIGNSGYSSTCMK